METINKIADKLVSFLRADKFVEAYRELFDEQAESIDPLVDSETPLKGLEKLIDSEISFLRNIHLKKTEVSEPIFAGNFFAVSLRINFYIGGIEKTIDELCLYKIENGKIISQQFFVPGKS